MNTKFMSISAAALFALAAFIMPVSASAYSYYNDPYAYSYQDSYAYEMVYDYGDAYEIYDVYEFDGDLCYPYSYCEFETAYTPTYYQPVSYQISAPTYYAPQTYYTYPQTYSYAQPTYYTQPTYYAQPTSYYQPSYTYNSSMSQRAYGVPTGRTNFYGTPQCNYAHIGYNGDYDCDSDPRQPVRDTYTGQWY